MPAKRSFSLPDHLNNSLGGMTVPVLGRAGRFPIAIHDAVECFEDACLVWANHDVGSMIDRDGTLRVVAKREARHTKNGRLFLESAGVGKDNSGSRFEIEELEIAERS